MKCGKGHDHGSVAEVRACYGMGDSGAATATAVLDYRPNKYAGNCAVCGNIVEEGKGRIDRRPSGKGYNVTHIGPCPAKAKGKVASEPERKPFPEVPAGHYATPSATGNNDLDFWRIDRPTEGTWKGRTFVKRVIGGRPNAPVRGRTMFAALEAILEAGVIESATLYGQKLDRCVRCNRHLTDQASRDNVPPMGPDCRNL